MYKSLQKQFESKIADGNFLHIIVQDELIGIEAPLVGATDIEISRNELKTLLMVADATLTKVDGEEKFVFDTDYASNGNNGLTEMTKDELEQIYLIMGLRSEAGADETNKIIEDKLKSQD